jgi:hypothetical protein
MIIGISLLLTSTPSISINSVSKKNMKFRTVFLFFLEFQYELMVSFTNAVVENQVYILEKVT